MYDVLYVLSATSNTVGSIAKYALVAGSWISNGTFTTTFGGFGLTAQNNGIGGSFLYVSTGQGASAANSVLRLTDATGYNTPISIAPAANVILYTAAAGTVVKGIALAPIISAPLAIHLRDLTAANRGAANIINWTTGHEDAGDYFELMRTGDNKIFTTLATIAGKGMANAYSFTDNTPLSGTNYYRLRMVDASGRITYSQTVTATANEFNNPLIIPNPLTGNSVQFLFRQTISGNYQILLYNNAGQAVFQQSAILNNEHRISVTLPVSLFKGTYHLLLTNGTEKFHQQLIIGE